MKKVTINDHPTVKQYYKKKEIMEGTKGRRIDTQWLRNLCLHAGADDVGFVSIDRNELED